MSKKATIIIFSLIILTALFLRVRSSLPILKVKGESLRWEDFSKNKEGLVRFRDLSKNSASNDDIGKGVLLSFIENTLVRKELESVGIKDTDAEKMADGVISGEGRDKIEAASLQLYGWTTEDFGKFVLIPQARRNLLDDEFQRKNIDFESWLEKSLPEARISIYLFRWKWSGSDIVKRF